jgi:hypothetical protein
MDQAAAASPEAPSKDSKLVAFFKRWLPITVAYVPVFGLLLGGVFTLYRYVDDQRAQQDKQAETRLLEAQKPFLQKQLDLYFETVQVTGVLVTAPMESKEWQTAERRFWALYWSELSMVEAGEVEGAMVRLGSQLDRHKREPGDATLQVLRRCVYDLAHTIRYAIEVRWQISSASSRTNSCPPG